MSSALLLAVCGVILFIAYVLYGRYLERAWGIDKKRVTPANALRDDVDYVPASRTVLFGHQFASIAGAGPIVGPIVAAMFGWVPVLLWIVLGGIFMGAVQDFATLYASVRNEGKSLGVLIERYVGKSGKVFFLIFSWQLCVLVIAFFGDVVAGTFNGFTATGKNVAGSMASSCSMFFIGFAILLGLILRKFKMGAFMQTVIAIAFLVSGLYIGMNAPIFLDQSTWLDIIFAYVFVASVLPMWLLLQPRDFMNAFLLLAMLIAAMIGIFMTQPTMNLPAFAGFEVKGQYLFPILFVTVSCGAISGVHAMVSTGTTSKQINNEKDMKLIGFGGMLLESFLALIVLVAVGALATATSLPEGSPPVVFAKAVSGFLSPMGMPQEITFSLITLAISSFALTTLDSVARIGRMCFQELFSGESLISRVFSNSIVATLITMGLGGLLAKAGYQSIMPLFGSANQLIGSLCLFAVALYLKRSGKKSWMLVLPMYSMLIVAFCALLLIIYRDMMKIAAGDVELLPACTQLLFAFLLLGVGVVVAKGCLCASFKKEE